MFALQQKLESAPKRQESIWRGLIQSTKGNIECYGRSCA